MILDDARGIIKAERETCKFYLKIDFGFLAGAFSIFTILKLERVDIFKTIISSKLFTTGIIALICYGLIFDYWLLIKWSLRNLTENQQKSVLKWSRVGIKTQLILHILLILGISSFVMGYSQGSSNGNAMASIMHSIENYNSEKKVFPKTFDDLISQYPDVLNDVNQLGRAKLLYTLDKDRGYVLQFAGSDGKLGTEDDVIEEHSSFLGKANSKRNKL